MNTESLDIAVAPYCTVAVEESLATFFDTQLPFEQWLSSIHTSQTNPAAFDTESIQPESICSSDCDVTFAGVLQVDGLLSGNIRSAHGTLVMTEHGYVKANVDVRVALIDGYLEGTLRATEQVVLDHNARVAGDIHSPSLTIRDGAVFEGTSYVLERSVYSGLCDGRSDQETVYDNYS